MIASDVSAAAMMLVIAVAVSEGIGLAGLCALAAVTAILTSVFRPAQAALLPALARTPEQLTAANAMATTIEGVAIFLGPGIGGILLSISGPNAVFVFAAAGLLWSAALVCWSTSPPGNPSPSPRTAPKAGSENSPPVSGRMVGATTVGGGRRVRRTDDRGRSAGGVQRRTGAAGIRSGNAGVGYLDSAFGVGGIIGGVLAAGLSGSRRLGAWFAFGAMVWGWHFTGRAVAHRPGRVRAAGRSRRGQHRGGRGGHHPDPALCTRSRAGPGVRRHRSRAAGGYRARGGSSPRC